MGNLFESFSHPDSIAFLLSVLVSFLIGFITAWILWGGRAKRLQRELDALTKKFNTLEAEMTPMQEQLNLKEADLVRATKEAGEAIFRSRALENDKNQWQLDLEAARLEADAAQANVHSYAATADDLNHQIIGLKTMLEQLTEENDTLRAGNSATVEGLNHQILSLKAHITQLSEEQEEQQEAIVLAATTQVQTQSDEDGALERISALENRLNLLNTENQALKIQAGTDNVALGQLTAFETRLNALSVENEALKLHLHTEQEEPAVDDSWYDQVTVRFNGLEERLTRLSDENESLKTELASLKVSQPAIEIVQETPVFVEVFGEMEEEEEEVKIVPETPVVVETLGEVEAEIETVSETPVVVEIVAEEQTVTKEEIISLPVSPADAAKASVLAAFGDKLPIATAAEKDDLTLIKGIGSFIEQKLNGLGIFTFEQIRRFDADLIEKVTAATEFFPGRIERDDWVAQATLLSQNALADAPFSIPLKQRRDLKIVEGIGTKIEKLLKDAGIKTLEELASTSEERLRKILLAAGEAYRIHDPGTWAAQAALAAKGEWEQLKQYQDLLDGGRVS